MRHARLGPSRVGRVVAIGLAGLLLVGCRDGGGDDDANSGTDGATGTDTGDDAGTDDGGTAADTGGFDDSIPAPGGLRRLLAHQYTASVRLLLGKNAAKFADPPRDPSIGGFDALATTESTPSPPDVEKYEKSGAAIAAAVVEQPDRLAETVPCVVAGPYNNSCYEALARDFGRLAWRRPLSEEQVATLVAVAKNAKAAEDGDFMAGVQYGLQAILQSPRFVYLVELGVEDGDEPRTLDAYELATRLSFFLLSRTPDTKLLDRAEAGELSTDDEIRAVAWKMVDDPGARDTVGRFYDELLTIRDIASKGKDADLFPTFSPELAEDMRTETLKLVEDIVFERDSDVLELLDADYTFVNEALADLYGVAGPGPGKWEQATLPRKQKRAGILTHPSWLAMQSHGNVNSPTRRGLFVQEQVLCNELPPPDPSANPEPIAPNDDETLREALTRHLTDKACATCHVFTDGMGFAFEHFDAMGRFRKLDNGKPIDSSGDIPDFGAFDNSADLAAMLRDDARTSRCLVNQVYTSGLGWAPGPDQAPALETVDAQFAGDEHNLKRLLVELTVSSVFRRVDGLK